MLDLLGGAVLLFLALLSTTTQTEDKVESGLLLDVIVAEGATVLELLARENQALLIRGDAKDMWSKTRIVYQESSLPLLVLDFGLDIVDSIRGFNLEGDGFTREGLDEDLHDCRGLCLSNELNDGVVDKSKF